MKMVRSDLASSGVIFTIDTETGFQDVIFITGSYGLGENVVQGAVNPDEFYVFKPTFRKGFRPIIRKSLGSKQIKMIYGSGEEKSLTRNVDVPEENRKRFCISDDEVLKLADYALKIEDYYSQKAGHFRPMDIEWAKDGLTGELFVVRPGQNCTITEGQRCRTYHLEERTGDRHREERRREDRQWQSELFPTYPIYPFSSQARSWYQHYYARLGTGDEEGLCHCHLFGREDQPCGHSQPRVRDSCSCRS
jgi:hypothetical protein